MQRVVHDDLEFENGERRRFDMRPLLAMKPWNRIAAPMIFSRAKVDYGTVVWPGDKTFRHCGEGRNPVPSRATAAFPRHRTGSRPAPG